MEDVEMKAFDAEVDKLLHAQPGLFNPPPTESIIINKEEIDFESIDTFLNKSIKKKNDKNNKVRERVVYGIINKLIPDSYYGYLDSWKLVRDEIDKYFKILVTKEDWDNIDKIECILKAGRQYTYDFEFIFHIKSTTKLYKIEFKYNAKRISDLPQIINLGKPSEYIDSDESFESFYYDKYLHKLFQFYNQDIPSKNDYLTQIGTMKPPCMKYLQDKYNEGEKKKKKKVINDKEVDFYNLCSQICDESLIKYLEKAMLNKEKMEKYFEETQTGKIYMLWYENQFNMEEINTYKIKTIIVEPNKYRFITIMEDNTQFSYLLRFKNGKGIAYPGFQIKVMPPPRPPPVAKLKKLCDANKLTYKKNIKKKNILALLDANSIAY
jgi:hypothetical protein